MNPSMGARPKHPVLYGSGEQYLHLGLRSWILVDFRMLGGFKACIIVNGHWIGPCAVDSGIDVKYFTYLMLTKVDPPE